MRMYDLIMKKRNGQNLTNDEIAYFINGYTSGSIPDYQVSALMMAIYFQGMNDEETVCLTKCMANSGELLHLDAIYGKKVDKHSTGGVGDKTSLALIPMVASVGVKIAKMSGRGLGHTGGTIDKLESFEGFRTGISTEQFVQQVNDIGVALMGQTADLAPADKKLYALRDVTATVDNMSLIASSIMSKKLAAGADCIVLDVKSGSGAFMKKEKDAYELASKMVSIGNMAGRKTMAVISDMDEPLGYAVGNALEVKEAIDTLNGNGPADFLELCLTLGSRMVYLGEKAASIEEARELLIDAINSKKALNKLASLVKAQGGTAKEVYDSSLLPIASYQDEVVSEAEGYISQINCSEVGICSLILGGGRETKDSVIDLSVGIVFHKKKGDFVKSGESIATIHYNDLSKYKEASKRLLQAITLTDSVVTKNPVILGIIS